MCLACTLMPPFTHDLAVARDDAANTRVRMRGCITACGELERA
jgi:hypothetical protein